MAMINPSDHEITVHAAGNDQSEVVCTCSWNYTVTDDKFIQSVALRHKIEKGVVIYDNNRKMWVEVA